MSMLRRSSSLLLACLALGLAACGGDDDSSTDQPADQGSTQVNPSQDSQADVDNNDSEAATSGGEIEIGMKNLQFEPKDVSAQVGQTVKWVNNESIPHNAVSQDGPQTFESDTFGKDGTYELKLTKAGTIDYVCTLHPGMEGSIKVEG